MNEGIYNPSKYFDEKNKTAPFTKPADFQARKAIDIMENNRAAQQAAARDNTGQGYPTSKSGMGAPTAKSNTGQGYPTSKSGMGAPTTKSNTGQGYPTSKSGMGAPTAKSNTGQGYPTSKSGMGAPTATGGPTPTTINSQDATSTPTITGTANSELGEFNIRSAPGTSNSIVKTCDTGSSYEILGATTDKDGDTWYKVRMEDGTEGYIGGKVYNNSTITSSAETTASSVQGGNGTDRGFPSSTEGMQNTIPGSHTVESGETLSSIVRGINSTAGANVMTVEALAILNGISDPNSINTGQELTLIANKEAVDGCVTRLNAWIVRLQRASDEITSALNTINSNVGTTGTALDGRLLAIKQMLDSNIATMINDATTFKAWMQELSESLTGDTAYVDTLLGNFGTNPISSV